MHDQHACWRELRQELAGVGIKVLDVSDLSAQDREWLRQRFQDDIFPILTPLAIDPAHPFPFIPNLGFSLAIKLENKLEANELNALVPIPGQLGRFIRLPGTEIRFVLIEDLVMLCLDYLFPGFVARDHGVFRVIRDSQLEIDEEAEGLRSEEHTS